MTSLYILVPISLIMGGLALFFFFWAIKKKQFDDSEGIKYRILDDDDEK
ncbi:cbb3-type cytochrome oxidase assembly protein [Calditerrivibrio sp.]|jgi:cbb3-type cytochrome oxidase maturation protein|uniref:Cbb3-type cytochrome oxidase assembly protein CcoS n=1 Tax=Calditerrivibrio nitroreducens TaxID=477976 RepID=A0A2J6WML0_9BACT|nr:MAG: cbb3-type cytochrome oxidase assembly protein CcoS [Calditerrivibrio nitroreducens]